MDMCEIDRRITGMIPRRRVLLFVRGFVLLINDNQSEVTEGKKHGRPCAQNNTVFILEHSRPYLGAFVIAHPGVVDTYGISEVLLQSLDDLRGKSDLRKQVQYLFTLLQILLDQPDV